MMTLMSTSWKNSIIWNYYLLIYDHLSSWIICQGWILSRKSVIKRRCLIDRLYYYFLFISSNVVNDFCGVKFEKTLLWAYLHIHVRGIIEMNYLTYRPFWFFFQLRVFAISLFLLRFTTFNRFIDLYLLVTTAFKADLGWFYIQCS